MESDRILPLYPQKLERGISKASPSEPAPYGISATYLLQIGQGKNTSIGFGGVCNYESVSLMNIKGGQHTNKTCVDTRSGIIIFIEN